MTLVAELTFIRIVRSELFKAASSPMVVVLTFTALLVELFFTLVVGVPGVQTAIIVTGLVGAIVGGADFSQSRALLLFTLVPRRRAIFLAKTLVAVGLAAIPMLLTLMLGRFVIDSFVHFDGSRISDGVFAELATGALLAVSFSAAIGLSIAVLLRSTLLGVVGWIALAGAFQLIPLMATALFTGGRFAWMLPDWAQALLPNQAFSRLMGGDYASASTNEWWLNYLGAGLWVAALFLPALLMIARKDVRHTD